MAGGGCSTEVPLVAPESPRTPFVSYDANVELCRTQAIQFILRNEQVLPASAISLHVKLSPDDQKARLENTSICHSFEISLSELLHVHFHLVSLYFRDAIEHHGTIQFYRGHLLLDEQLNL